MMMMMVITKTTTNDAHGHNDEDDDKNSNYYRQTTPAKKTKTSGKPYKRLQSQGHVHMAYRCCKFNAYAYCLLCIRKKISAKKKLGCTFSMMLVPAADFFLFKVLPRSEPRLKRAYH